MRRTRQSDGRRQFPYLPFAKYSALEVVRTSLASLYGCLPSKTRLTLAVGHLNLRQAILSMATSAISLMRSMSTNGSPLTRCVARSFCAMGWPPSAILTRLWRYPYSS